MKTPPWITFAFTKHVVKFFHLHTGGNDFMLFWWVKNVGIMEVFFIKIK